MGHGHELGQGWVPEGGIVRQADVSDVEVNEPGVVVVALPECRGFVTADVLMKGLSRGSIATG